MANQWSNLDWDALAEQANMGMNGNGAQVEAIHRAVVSNTKMSLVMNRLTWAIAILTLVSVGIALWQAVAVAVKAG